MIQFCAFQFETRLENKLNYNLYIHVKLIFWIYTSNHYT